MPVAAAGLGICSTTLRTSKWVDTYVLLLFGQALHEGFTAFAARIGFFPVSYAQNTQRRFDQGPEARRKRTHL